MSNDKECAEKMEEIRQKHSGDEEVCHSLGDDLLCEILTELGFKETVKKFEQLPKWYA